MMISTLVMPVSNSCNVSCMSASTTTISPTPSTKVIIDKRRYKELLEIEKHYVDIIALGVKKYVEEEKRTPK